ncbi:imidazole glycerol phosphate synthase subunit HisH [Methanocella arvoryzae]|uniref:Imidazole glycerol phosphate synthase subunit HisH n=1 Tax=Methanocella arvoryzae (strain DSM 22066 / NBRC 105507 / MRE50) TaxID=351160 RepID=Q0W3E9_METAR|nr:imidazole glycerol phosphate synthase subunit HisH [Methanocella arvoryzae]CAJ37094.1 imidazole glycerol phosphate synthase, glutamine amidotransferase subunit [Methanocella arvoryzae MRE50]
MIVIVDYGMGNLRSILNKFERMEVEAKISSDPAEIERADKLVLPGVGAFDAAMQNLRQRGLIPVLEKKVLREKTPIMGICLGMQLFTKHSEEGNVAGLGWIDARTVRFRLNGSGLRVPHMGWNSITVDRDWQAMNGLETGSRFYFVHSYHVCCNDPADRLATTNYGIDFTSMVQRDNILGVQFHPERSHRYGAQLLENFVRW